MATITVIMTNGNHYEVVLPNTEDYNDEILRLLGRSLDNTKFVQIGKSFFYLSLIEAITLESTP